MGWMGVRFKQKRSFREEELQLVLALANQATLASQVIRLSEQARQAAIESERNRLARDMHDTLAQGFTGVIVQLEAAEDAIVQGLTRAADQHISQAGEMARYGLTEARRSVQALRPRLLEENDLCTALKKMIQRTATGTGLQANLTVKGQPQPLPSHWDEHVLRISQEVLTNTLRHAQAGNFMATIQYHTGKFELELRDDGRGFSATERHDGFGLTGIQERVAQMGGSLMINGSPGRGVTVFVTLPLIVRDTGPAANN
jgi:signal transduction histidine kinase